MNKILCSLKYSLQPRELTKVSTKGDCLYTKRCIDRNPIKDSSMLSSAIMDQTDRLVCEVYDGVFLLTVKGVTKIDRPTNMNQRSELVNDEILL